MEYLDIVILPDGNPDFHAKAEDLLGKKATPTKIQKKIKELKILWEEQRPERECNERIENTIYAEYSRDKQSQDEKWARSYSAKLKAAGVENIDEHILNVVKTANLGMTLDIEASKDDIVNSFDVSIINKIQGDSVSDKADYARLMVEKLIKVALRTEWAEQIKHIAKAALVNKSQPEFPPFRNCNAGYETHQLNTRYLPRQVAPHKFCKASAQRYP